MAPTDTVPYQRETSPYRKDQFDNGKEPGEQSLTGWWIRSQSSFHVGSGIKFYDPSSGETTPYRFNDSRGVDVWTKGQVTLLKDVTTTHLITDPVDSVNYDTQHLRSIKWNGIDGVLLHDGYDVDKIYPAITVSISNKALTSDVATLTTSAAHGLSAGMQITITGVDATFNGTYKITGVPTTTTFTYAKVNTNVTSAAVSPVGTGVSEIIHFIDNNTGADTKVYAICDDGTYAYWATNTGNKFEMFKKLLTADSGTAGTSMMTSPSVLLTNGEMEFVKDRIILCFNNTVYEISPTATALPGTPNYTNPNTSYKYTSIAASGPAVYTAGYSGLYSSIQKYTLSTTTGSMPTLSQASTAAELPAGEIVHKLYYYLGYMVIGTSKGVRVATVNDQDGSLAYGPLVIETNQPVYDFAARDRFIWCATGVGSTDAGLARIDLGQLVEGEPLRFAWAYDLQYAQSTKYPTTALAFIGETNRLAFCTAAIDSGTVTNKALTSDVATLTTSTAHGLVQGDSVWVEGVGSPFDSTTGAYTVTGVPTTTTFTYAKVNTNVSSTAVSSSAAKVNKVGNMCLESASTLVPTGYVTSGAIRYGTLEPKHYKFVRARGEFTNGAMDIAVISDDNLLYNVITYNSTTGSPEAATTSPEGSHEYLSYKFTLSRSATNTSLGPIFKGYQAKALPATKRQRLIQFPVWCFDVETDRYNVKTGYDGRAWERIETLENLEALGDVINVQDFTTSERVQAVIERIQFSRKTPPSGNFSGFGGVLLITVRTILQ